MLSVESLKLSPVQLRHLLAASRSNSVFLDKGDLCDAYLQSLELVGALLDANAGLQHELTAQRDYTAALSAQVDDLERSAMGKVLDAGAYQTEIDLLKSERSMFERHAEQARRAAAHVKEQAREWKQRYYDLEGGNLAAMQAENAKLKARLARECAHTTKLSNRVSELKALNENALDQWTQCGIAHDNLLRQVRELKLTQKAAR
ncbi:hypothetical protein SAMN05446935_0352 [Burkholderia sp. YR290]|nr:hypothetical protein SAMN05446935_0352 [Burkholderia sp. YR290]